MACRIFNPNQHDVTLPFPLRGVIPAGKAILVSAAKSVLLAALGSTSLRLIEMGSVGASNLQDWYLGNLLVGDTTTGASSGDLLVYRYVFAAGTAGTADDVTVVSGLPNKIQVLDVTLRVSTLIGGSTCTLRDAVGGAGNALSSALSSATVALVRDALTSVAPVVPAGGGLYLRRSDRGVAGSVVVQAMLA